ncbi:MAG: hypothetical protein GWP33_08580 [Alphaproteobacteria bacterium]|nr:hypothetical protein [Alphaproteobacteria bacterium]
MAKRVQHEKPPRSKKAEKWIEDECAQQVKRHATIVEEMESIQDKRDGWVAEFLKFVQVRGCYVTGDMRVKIPAEDIPKKPKRKDADRVVW